MISVEERQKCLEACLECMEACNQCYTACLEEKHLDMMRGCLRLDRECADICAYAAKAITSQSPYMQQICALCAQICEDCAQECAKHDHDHCQRCAEACRHCAEACRSMAA
ncbi:four-helix bundle copper-binding protein [Paenibacillus kyungheensis]|uniref:Four-helix bundle copper-binding protein n=1 Tax=Paenibacillus kyungheensis TaxID=1452732 RepID=A0AAX3M6C0_9BACL|nr:four-helix bundle copper-binding protein [Paenibacillus kyungheensis]WCT57473.1 four-helix bundle copper-binding protein [Paenibacillus kyungheensis]